MAFIGNFNVADLPKSEGFEPVPAGWYVVKVSDAGVKDTKDGTGKYIKLSLDVVGPTHSGRKIFANLNIQNKSPEAERIGHQQLREIMQAVGLQTVKDTDQLIGVVLQAKVAVKPASGDYEAGNEVKGYKPTDSVINISSMLSAEAKESVAEGNAKKAPW